MVRKLGLRLAAAVVIALVFSACSSSKHATTAPNTQATSTTASTVIPTTVTSSTTAPPPPSTATTRAGRVPGPVTITYSGQGGGTGEITVRWDAVPEAIGYRVLRSSSPSGPFGVVAQVNVLTGAATVAKGVVNLWAQHQKFVPPPYTHRGTTPSSWFEYVEVSAFSGNHYYRVIAYNDAGAGPSGAVVCGTAIGEPPC